MPTMQDYRRMSSAGDIMPLANARRYAAARGRQYQPPSYGQGLYNYGGVNYVNRSSLGSQGVSARPRGVAQGRSYGRVGPNAPQLPTAQAGSFADRYPDLSVYPTVNPPGQAPPAAPAHIPPAAAGTISEAIRNMLPAAAASPQPRSAVAPAATPQDYGPMMQALFQMLYGGQSAAPQPAPATPPPTPAGPAAMSMNYLTPGMKSRAGGGSPRPIPLW